jgi:hypothetical protein
MKKILTNFVMKKMSFVMKKMSSVMKSFQWCKLFFHNCTLSVGKTRGLYGSRK